MQEDIKFKASLCASQSPVQPGVQLVPGKPHQKTHMLLGGGTDTQEAEDGRIHGQDACSTVSFTERISKDTSNAG